MKIRELLNIVLLSVSLSTVLISIISYILFKLKQKSNSNKTQNPLEGVYYRRYAPHVEKKFLAEEEERKKKGTVGTGNRLKLGVVFGLVLVVILTALLLENYYNYRANINNKIITANRIRELIDDGLLQVYKYNPKLDVSSQDEKISDVIKNFSDNVSTSLKENQFCIFTNSQSQKYYNFHQASVRNWSSFFQSVGLNYKTTENLNIDNCIYVFPSVHSLNTKQRDEIQVMSNSGRPMIIIGYLGLLDGVGEKTTSLFNEVSLKASSNETGVRIFHSRLNNSLSVLPPGKILSFDSKDILREFGTSKESLIVDKELQRTIYKVQDKKLFIGIDPHTDNKSESNYINIFLLNEIGKISKVDLFYPSFWPKNFQGALSISLEVGDHFQLNNKFLEILGDKKLAFSLIIPQNYIQNYVQSFDAKFSEVIPLLKQTEANEDMAIYEVFSFLSKLRLDIEEKAALKVEGYTHQNRIQNLKTFNAALQNQLKYFLGPEKYLNSIPVKLDDDFYFVESMNYEDIQSDKKLMLEEKPLQKIFKTRVVEDGGLLNYVLKANEVNRIDQENFLKSILDYEQLDKFWFTDVASVVKWFSQREKVSLSLYYEGENVFLRLKNKSEQKIKDYSVVCLTNKLPVDKKIELIKLNNVSYRLNISELKPNAEINIQLK